MSGADPQMNHLRIGPVNLIEASIAIGQLIGISRAAYLNDHPSQLPGCYVALNGGVIESGSVRASRTAIYTFSRDQSMAVTPQLAEHLAVTVKGSSLRPSPAQLTTPHPAYLDCIIFPHLRDAAVRASADGILDHVSLFTDLLSGGLVCWGSASDSLSLSRRRRRHHSMSDSVAWSTRSWEATPWFLAKWAWLIGSENDERLRGDTEGVWLGSRWWRNLRGDLDSDSDSDLDSESDYIAGGGSGSGGIRDSHSHPGSAAATTATAAPIELDTDDPDQDTSTNLPESAPGLFASTEWDPL